MIFSPKHETSELTEPEMILQRSKGKYDLGRVRNEKKVIWSATVFCTFDIVFS